MAAITDLDKRINIILLRYFNLHIRAISEWTFSTRMLLAYYCICILIYFMFFRLVNLFILNLGLMLLMIITMWLYVISQLITYSSIFINQNFRSSCTFKTASLLIRNRRVRMLILLLNLAQHKLFIILVMQVHIKILTNMVILRKLRLWWIFRCLFFSEKFLLIRDSI
jgi:hypothetical protein